MNRTLLASKILILSFFLSMNAAASTVYGTADIRMNYIFVTTDFSCNLTVETTIFDNGSGISVSIDDIEATNSSCSSIEFMNFPWTGFVPYSSLPTSPSDTILVPLVLADVEVSFGFASCTGSLTANISSLSYNLETITGVLPGTPNCNIAMVF